MHESQMHDVSCFLTLTYAQEPENGSLNKKHCQDFLKRLRSRIEPTKVRFFLCGEYGEKLGRPHYHLLLFGYDFPDKVVLKNGKNKLWRSDLLDEIWSHGFCSIGAVSFDSAVYVANYATKKITNKESYTDEKGRYWPSKKEHYGKKQEEFLLMSRGDRSGDPVFGYGIGAGWLDKFESDVFPDDEVIVNGYPSKPPRFYDTRFEKRDAVAYERLKAKREEAGEKTETLVLRSGKKVEVTPSMNLRKLAAKKKNIEAKLRQKTRNLEK